MPPLETGWDETRAGKENAGKRIRSDDDDDDDVNDVNDVNVAMALQIELQWISLENQAGN